MTRCWVGILAAAAAALANSAHGQTTASTEPQGWSSPQFAIRSDFNNLPVIPDQGCQPAGAAEPPPVCEVGAVISYKHDQIAKTSSAAVDGVALASLNYTGGSGPIQDGVVAAFVQSNGTNQFATGSSQNKASDIITPGALAQVSVADGLFGTTDSVRVRAGEAIASSGTRDFTTVAEWQPHLPFSAQAHLGRFGIVLDPELMLQYDQLVGGPATYHIFGTQHEALRIGPQLTILVWGNASYPPKQADWVRNFGLNITAHASDDVLGCHGYGWIQSTLSYKLTKNFSLSASYGYGNSDITGNLQQQAKIGLSVKWDSKS